MSQVSAEVTEAAVLTGLLALLDTALDTVSTEVVAVINIDSEVDQTSGVETQSSDQITTTAETTGAAAGVTEEREDEEYDNLINDNVSYPQYLQYLHSKSSGRVLSSSLLHLVTPLAWISEVRLMMRMKKVMLKLRISCFMLDTQELTDVSMSTMYKYWFQITIPFQN